MESRFIVWRKIALALQILSIVNALIYIYQGNYMRALDNVTISILWGIIRGAYSIIANLKTQMKNESDGNY